MRQSPPATLFDVAGLAEQATSADVKVRWEQVVKAAGGKLASIDAAVRNAFLVLSAPQNLELYRDLLRSCREETNIPVQAAEIDTFTRFCAMCLITPFQHPQQRELFAVCLAGQTVPQWVRYDPRTMSHLRMRWGQRLEQLIQRYLLGGVFRGRSGGQRVGIVLAYLVLFGLVGAGGRAIVLAWVPVPAAVAHGATPSTHSVSSERVARGATPSTHADSSARMPGKPAPDLGPLTAVCERVSANLRHVDEQATIVAREFQEVAQISLDDAASRRAKIPDAVELTIAQFAKAKQEWSAILGEHLDAAELATKKSALAAIRHRIADKAPLGSDEQDARELDRWTETARARLADQREKIGSLRQYLKLEKYDRPLDPPDRSKP